MLHILSNVLVMSKQPIAEEGGDFWKKIRYSATATAAIGAGLFAITSVIKKQGFVSNLVDEMQAAMHAAPQLLNEPPNTEVSKPGFQTPADDAETRAILETQLHFAITHGKLERVKEITRQLDELEAVSRSLNLSAATMMPNVNMPQMQTQMPMPMSIGISSPVNVRSAQSFPTDMTGGNGQVARGPNTPIPMGMQSSMPQVAARAMPEMQTPGMPGAQMPGMQTPGMPGAQMPGMQTPGIPGAQMPGMQMPGMPGMKMAGMQTPGMPGMQMAGMQTPGMPGMQMAGMQTPGMQDALQSSTPCAGKPVRAQTPLAGDEGTTRPRKVAKSMDPARHAAMLGLRVGDLVEALDPVTGVWTPGTVSAITKTGLVDVRWDDPGTDASGKPYHPIGEIWAEQIRIKHRPPATPISPPPQPKELEQKEEQPVDPPDGLKVGDNCFALGYVVEKKWFHAKIIDVRGRAPPLRIEFLSTLDGQMNELLLPSPRKDYIHVDQVRRDKPEDPPEAPRRSSPQEAEQASQETQVAEQEDRVVISPDLMCSICERPDDESHMLVCDCKKGFHIYCLSPALDAVPEGDWKCPTCAKKK